MFSVLPLRAIAFQCLFLLLAIAIEAAVLHEGLKLPYRKSVEYAASINLLSTAIGWLIFFSIEPLVPTNLKFQLINCIFFDQWSSGIAAWIIFAGFVTFFISFLVKLSGLDLLKLLLQDKEEKRSEQEIQADKSKRYQNTIRARKNAREGPSRANAVLIANALSYTAILLVLFIRIIVPADIRL
ncbi:filament integrity protein fraC [Oculatella sp. FACHB-28]|uniref:filament integrity protein FraC n=1 Tax=Cyanophyceae TaxID=3028117 RepID=UPI001688D5B5|nr:MULTISPECIES: filament integrity protein FraC [Cyanophyceae]MBD1871443.1 filament integrity protein fraC [Cyanobacteria bacterium FACHB-471]MBD2057238.1 filament integrity protein fraC [Oculatella sp. FACHB-28]MBD2072201.1 filament integrity protein fraC [Leptolyngbya sp. FACHB-671]